MQKKINVKYLKQTQKKKNAEMKEEIKLTLD